MSTAWVNPPPVIAVTGTDKFLAGRFVREGIAVAEKQGRRVSTLDGEEHEALQGCLSGGFMFSDEQLVILTNPIKADMDMLWRHHEAKDNGVVVVVYHEGALAKSTRLWKHFVSKIPKPYHRQIDAPPFYEMDEYAANFVVKEAKRHGKGISKDSATALVRAVGTDLGVLSFEVFKVGCLLDSLGLETIGKDHLAKVVANLGGSDVNALVDAVAMMQPVAIMRKLAQIQKGASGDPTIMVCRRLGTQALKWLQSAALVERGIPVTEAARAMGVNRFYYEKNILPVARAWSKDVFLRLFRNTVEVEKGVKKGHLHPWAELETLLVVTAYMARRGR